MDIYIYFFWGSLLIYWVIWTLVLCNLISYQISCTAVLPFFSGIKFYSSEGLYNNNYRFTQYWPKLIWSLMVKFSSAFYFDVLYLNVSFSSTFLLILKERYSNKTYMV